MGRRLEGAGAESRLAAVHAAFGEVSERIDRHVQSERAESRVKTLLALVCVGLAGTLFWQLCLLFA
jgi:hypothetical protein